MREQIGDESILLRICELKRGSVQMTARFLYGDRRIQPCYTKILFVRDEPLLGCTTAWNKRLFPRFIP